MRIFTLAIFIVVILVLVYGMRVVMQPERFQAAAPQDYPFYTGMAKARAWNKPYYELTDGERVQYIIDTYYSLAGSSEDEDRQAENDMINALPTDGSCADDYSECAAWAAAGECTINPEFMLYKCKGACQSCALNPQQLNDVTAIYNSRPVDHSVYHGENYPGRFPYMKNLYSLI